MKLTVFLTGLTLTGLIALPNAQADSYMFTDLPLIAQGINNAGQVVGIGVAGETTYGLLYDRGSLTTIFVPGSRDTLANGINNQGQIAGYYVEQNGLQLGFLDNNNSFISFAVPPGGGATAAQGINDAGQIVGYSGSFSFFYDGSTYRTISVPGARSTNAYGLNNAGEAVGSYTDTSGRTHGFYFDRQGVLTTLDVPGSRDTAVYGINNVGVLVGSFLDSFSDEHGFVYSGGIFTTLDAPGGNTAARGINDSGQIVTSGRGGDFLATPVPEPTSLTLLALGLAGFGRLIPHKSSSRRNRRHPASAC